jgi:hypothetical protein
VREHAFPGPNWTFSTRPPCGTDGGMKRTTSKPTIAPPTHRGSRALAGGQTLRTWTIGPLPLVNQLLQRVQLERFLQQYLPRDGRRMAVPTSREPIYGLGEWAERFVPAQLGLREADGEHLNDV